jgi:hypothetical protein
MYFKRKEEFKHIHTYNDQMFSCVYKSQYGVARIWGEQRSQDGEVKGTVKEGRGRGVEEQKSRE